VCDLETSRMGAPYIYDISHLRVNARLLRQISGFDHETVHVGFVVGEMALGHLVSPSNSVLPCRYHSTNSVLPCRYHSTNAPYSFLSQYCSCMKDKRVQPGNLTKRTCNCGQTSSFSSVFSVMKQGERVCGATCNKTALCNL